MADEFQRFFQIVYTFIAQWLWIVHPSHFLTYLFPALGSFTADCTLLVLRYLMPCLYSSCDRKANLRGNSLPQTPHEYCILSACACAFTLWQTKFDIWLKPLPHNSHLYGRSLVCVNTWFRKLPKKINFEKRFMTVHFTLIYATKIYNKIIKSKGERRVRENFITIKKSLGDSRNNRSFHNLYFCVLYLFDEILYRIHGTCAACAPSVFSDGRLMWIL